MADQLYDSDDDIATLLNESDNTIYLTHFQATFVTESDKNQYFTLSSVGNGELRLYKKSAQALLGHLHQAHAMGKKLEKLMGERKLPDKTYFEKTVDERTDKKTGTNYRLNLTLSIYMGKVCLYLRSFYYIEEEQRYQPTKRAVQFAINDDDYTTFRKFIFEVASPQNPTNPFDECDSAAEEEDCDTSHRLGSTGNANKKKFTTIEVDNKANNKNKKRRKDVVAAKVGGSRH